MDIKLPTPTIMPTENDYEVDGILYCGACNKPKTKLVKLNRAMYPVPIACDCVKARNERIRQEEIKAEVERQERERREKIESLRYEAFPDLRMRNWTFAEDDKANAKISDIAQKYVDNFSAMSARGMGLLLYGGVGTGKTFISACIANALIDEGYTCFATNFASLSNTLQSSFSGRQELMDKLASYSLLVIDDLASERDTEYMGEVVQNVIDARYRAQKPLIVTTNLTGEELKHPKDIRKERIYSRLFEMCIPVEVKGVDRRKKKLRDSNKDLKKLLGI